MLHIMKCSLSTISLPPQISGSWMSGHCPIPNQQNTYLLLKTTGDQIIHVCCPDQWLELGKMYEGTALWKQMSKELQNILSWSPERSLIQYIFTPSLLQNTLQVKFKNLHHCLELLNIRTFLCVKFFKIKPFFSCKISTLAIPTTFPITWEWIAFKLCIL